MEYRINITEVDTGNVLSLVSYSTSITVQFLHPFYTYASIVSAVTIDEGPYSELFMVTTPEDGKILNKIMTIILLMINTIIIMINEIIIFCSTKWLSTELHGNCI